MSSRKQTATRIKNFVASLYATIFEEDFREVRSKILKRIEVKKAWKLIKKLQEAIFNTFGALMKKLF